MQTLKQPISIRFNDYNGAEVTTTPVSRAYKTTGYTFADGSTLECIITKHPLYPTAWYAFEYKTGWLLAPTGSLTRSGAILAFQESRRVQRENHARNPKHGVSDEKLQNILSSEKTIN